MPLKRRQAAEAWRPWRDRHPRGRHESPAGLSPAGPRHSPRRFGGQAV